MPETALGYLEMVSGVEEDLDDSTASMNVGGYPRRLSICRHRMVKFGRNEKECDLVFRDPVVSSIHCVFWAILFDEESSPMCYIKDCSLNGTYLNGSLLKRNSTYLLQDGDTVELHDQDNRAFMFKALTQEERSPLANQLGFERAVGHWEVTSRVIGNGTFGHVLVAYKKTAISRTKESSLTVCKPENFAVKIIKLKPNKLDKEAKILLKLNHVC